MAPAFARLVLIGFMGSGKSTVGPRLAGLLGWGYRDLDTWIEERAGCRIAEIFEQRGEGAFRELERQAALEAQRLERFVIAAGGGAFAFPETRRLLQTDAITVWLRCDLEVILRRVGHDPSRPLATDRERMQRLLREREPSYGMTDLTVDAARDEPDEVARHIHGLVLSRANVSHPSA